jgi:hypothetical protein
VGRDSSEYEGNRQVRDTGPRICDAILESGGGSPAKGGALDVFVKLT